MLNINFNCNNQTISDNRSSLTTSYLNIKFNDCDNHINSENISLGSLKQKKTFLTTWLNKYNWLEYN